MRGWPWRIAARSSAGILTLSQPGTSLRRHFAAQGASQPAASMRAKGAARSSMARAALNPPGREARKLARVYPQRAGGRTEGRLLVDAQAPRAASSSFV